MATRPVFVAQRTAASFVHEKPVEFRWHAGLAVSQKQKSIAELHAAAKATLSIERILEISSKSPDALGVALSAFNLKLNYGERQISVEVAFQSSKVFLDGGPYLDLLDATPRDAKADPRLKQSGRLRTFRFQGVDWPLQPATVFYDWLYLTALAQNPQLAEPLADYQAFTDIEFNPEKSINCQARSAALYVGLRREGLFYEALSSTEAYLRLTLGQSTAASQIALC
jgi:hypothetical protein